LAQGGTETIVLIPEGAELPAVVTAAIDLPKDENGNYRPAAAAVDNSVRGLAIANEARENGRAFGEAMAAQAQENRENKARGGRPDLPELPPGQPPGDVALPTLPQIPAAPPVPARPDVPAAPPGRP
jgi:hypothetical protein